MRRCGFIAIAVLWVSVIFHPNIVRATVSVDSAINWAENQIGSNRNTECGQDHEWYLWCGRFVAHAYGLCTFGFDSAINGWDSPNGVFGSKHTDTDINSIPKGALVFFDPDPVHVPEGHVGLSIGNGQMIHAWTSGVEQSSIDSISNYLGWRWPYAWTYDDPILRITAKCAGDICWEPADQSCENANLWIDVSQSPFLQDSSVCNQIYGELQYISEATNPAKEIPEQHWWQSWWRALISVFGQAASASEIKNYTVIRDLEIPLESSVSVSVVSGNGTSVKDGTGYGYEINPTESPSSSSPDFIVNKLWLETNDGVEKYTYYKSETIQMKAQLKNIGSGSIGNDDKIETRFYLSEGYKEDDHSEWIRVGTDETRGDNLDPGETHTETEGINLWEYAEIEVGRAYNIVACPDRLEDDHNEGGAYAERHESNNCSTEAVFTVVAASPPKPINRATMEMYLKMMGVY